MIKIHEIFLRDSYNGENGYERMHLQNIFLISILLLHANRFKYDKSFIVATETENLLSRLTKGNNRMNGKTV